MSLGGYLNAQKPGRASVFRLKFAHASGCCRQGSYLAVHNTIIRPSLSRRRAHVRAYAVSGGLKARLIRDVSGAIRPLAIPRPSLRWLDAGAAADEGEVAAAKPAMQPVEQQVDHRCRVERECLRHQQPADDRDAERPAQF